MDNHITFVGILRIGLSILGAAMVAIVAVVLVGVGVGVSYRGPREVLPILSAVAFGITIAAVVFSVPGIVGGIGVLRRKNWARYLVIVLSVLDLLAVPVGTVLGIYALWVLTHKQTVQEFDGLR